MWLTLGAALGAPPPEWNDAPLLPLLSELSDDEDANRVAVESPEHGVPSAQGEGPICSIEAPVALELEVVQGWLGLQCAVAQEGDLQITLELTRADRTRLQRAVALSCEESFEVDLNTLDVQSTSELRVAYTWQDLPFALPTLALFPGPQGVEVVNGMDMASILPSLADVPAPPGFASFRVHGVALGVQ
ncbi:MAG: hypothetical protein H6734_11885 [Alphaproteobacteria bacterium]|nr:hypothetical protein [Alphaproteobacteria bacterium]